MDKLDDLLEQSMPKTLTTCPYAIEGNGIYLCKLTKKEFEEPCSLTHKYTSNKGNVILEMKKLVL